MHKIWLVARRDYLASIRTKSFVFGLVVAPLLFGGSFIGLAMMKEQADLRDRTIAIVDRSGGAAESVVHAAEMASERNLLDKKTRKQVRPRYRFEVISPDGHDDAAQRLTLSERVRHGDLFAVVEIPADALDRPKSAGADDDVNASWYSKEGGMEDTRRWFSGPLNEGIRRARLKRAGVDTSRFDEALRTINLQSMTLLSKDTKTGQIQEAGKKRDMEAFGVAFSVTMLLAMIVMFTAGPMLPGIAEDKMQRVFEMLLASATPFELIAGKVLAALGRSLTSAVVYIAAALLVLNSMTMLGLAPIALIPWFVIYLVVEITMLCAFASALGAACGSPQDAQSLGIVLLAPVMIPLFMLAPVIQRPDGPMATAMSMFPLFAPVIMLTRQAMPGGVPWWQPWVGLVGSLLAAVAICWVAARVFRIGILLQGKPPNLADLMRWAIRG